MWKRLLATVAVVVLVGVSLGSASAQESGQGLEISPPLVEINTDPGKTVSFNIKVRNITRGTLIANGRIDDFVAKGEEGEAKLLIEKGAEPSPYSFKTWADPIPGFRIVSQEVKSSKITLHVPNDASPGGHYGVVRFTATPPELEDTGVALSASIGTLVLINVSGDVQTKAKLIEFYSAQNGQKKGFFEKGPITFVERLSNEGNVHFKPIGTLRVTNMLGKEVEVLSINSKGGNVLPNSVRRFEQQLNKEWLFGKYTVEANIQYSGQNLTSSISFWVIPYKLIAIILGALLVIIVALRAGLRSYGRRAVKKATGQSSSPKKKKKK